MKGLLCSTTSFTCSADSMPLCSRAQRQDTAVVRMAVAVLPACHTQLGRIMVWTTRREKSRNRSRESRVWGALITRRDRREKNLRRSSASFSGLRLVSRMGTMSSNRVPTTSPVGCDYSMGYSVGRCRITICTLNA